MAEGKIEIVPFKEPLRIDLDPNPDMVEFIDAQQLLDWANVEIQWSKSAIRGKNEHGPFERMYQQQEFVPKNIAELADKIIRSGVRPTGTHVKNIREQLEKFRYYSSIHSQSRLGQIISSLNNGWAVPGALAASLTYPVDEFAETLNSEQMSAFAGGYIASLSALSRLRDARMFSIQRQLNQLIETSQIEAENRSAENERFQKKISLQAATMEAIARQLKEHTNLQSSADYWKDRAAKSLQYAQYGGAAFGLIAATGLIGAVFGYPHLLREFVSEDGSLGAGVIGLITAPAVIILTAMALAFRSVTSWLKDASSADERRTMVQTYLALTGDEKNPIDEHHRRHILDRMFTATSAENTISDQVNPYLEALRALRDAPKPDN